MELSSSLIYLIKRCETGCDSGCCGLNAYDFSPINIASSLNSVFGSNIEQVRQGLMSLKNSVNNKALQYPILINEINHQFSREEIISFIDEIEFNLNIAI